MSDGTDTQQDLLSYMTKRVRRLETENEDYARQGDTMRRLLTEAHEFLQPYVDLWESLDRFFNPENYSDDATTK